MSMSVEDCILIAKPNNPNLTALPKTGKGKFMVTMSHAAQKMSPFYRIICSKHKTRRGTNQEDCARNAATTFFSWRQLHNLLPSTHHFQSEPVAERISSKSHGAPPGTPPKQAKDYKSANFFGHCAQPIVKMISMARCPSTKTSQESRSCRNEKTSYLKEHIMPQHPPAEIKVGIISTEFSFSVLFGIFLQFRWFMLTCCKEFINLLPAIILWKRANNAQAVRCCRSQANNGHNANSLWGQVGSRGATQMSWKERNNRMELPPQDFEPSIMEEAMNKPSQIKNFLPFGMSWWSTKKWQ